MNSLEEFLLECAKRQGKSPEEMDEEDRKFWYNED